ncbi:MAG: phosphoribosylanthranilate isomerase [Candidatus Omnitrophica bacterium]|nr:phosphoribosylanthranilate isomerase [Candidatus Omnitrophota bacterium]
MTKVKICGITNADDAQFAISCGADYVGLIFAPSKRRIIKETAMRILKKTKNFNTYVGVFLNGRKKEIEEICSSVGIRIVQFHGEETPAFCNYFINRGYDVIKAFRIKNIDSFDAVRQYEKVTKFLFDTFSIEEHGGTGKVFDWSLVKKIDFLKDRDVFISGGISADNAFEVIRALNPYAIDASSQLEIKPGVKDKGKVKQLIEAVHGVKDDN